MRTITSGNVAVSGDTAWHTSEQVTLPSSYKKYYIKAGVHGAAYNSVILDESDIALIGSGSPFVSSAYWDDSNLGQIQISGHTLQATAKTKDYTFDYYVYGLS